MLKTVILLGAFVSATTVPPTAPEEAWLQRLKGRWEGTVDGERYVETWTCADGSCEGKSTTYRGDVEAMSEILRITSFSDHWIYMAAPGGRNVTCFVRVEADADTWVFENKEHDFPQRIGYQLTGADELTAWIEGPGEQGIMRIDYTLRRKKG